MFKMRLFVEMRGIETRVVLLIWRIIACHGIINL
jgi:hypothetical protein